MKLIKMERVKMGDSYPIVRITYKSFLRKITRDTQQGICEGHWQFVDTGNLCYAFMDSIALFYKTGEREYEVNKTRL